MSDEKEVAAPRSARDQILQLQQEMQADQGNVAKELVDVIAGETAAELIKQLTALRDRSVPGQLLDQQISQTIMVLAQLGQVGAQLYQQILQQQQAQQQQQG